MAPCFQVYSILFHVVGVDIVSEPNLYRACAVFLIIIRMNASNDNVGQLPW